jgi:hypothetical protein
LFVPDDLVGLARRAVNIGERQVSYEEAAKRRPNG